MAFIRTVPEDQAPPAVAQMYEADAAGAGYLPNYTRAFSHRPGVYAAWKQLGAAVRANVDPRRYELVTLAAARQMRSSYCALAHGKILAEEHLGSEDLQAVVAGEDGLDDGEIFDVVATAALRCFFSKVLDGLGVQPDAAYADLEPGLRDALAVGRTIAAG